MKEKHTCARVNCMPTYHFVPLCFITLMCVMCQEQEESLKEVHLSPVRENNVELLQEILRDLDPFKHRSHTAAELASILTQPHFQVKNLHAKLFGFQVLTAAEGGHYWAKPNN